MTPQEVVERYLAEALGGGEPAAVKELVASDELVQRTTRLRVAFPGLEIEPRVLVARAELVACHAAARGTHLGLFQGVPPTGRTWQAGLTGVYRVEQGRIADAWVTWDFLALMEQLGAIRRAETVSA